MTCYSCATAKNRLMSLFFFLDIDRSFPTFTYHSEVTDLLGTRASNYHTGAHALILSRQCPDVEEISGYE